MASIRQYVLRLVCAAMASGIVLSLMKQSALKEQIRLICGLFLTYSILSPLIGLELPALPTLSVYTREGETAVSVGQNYAQKAQAQYISKACEAYILDKAEQLELSLRVEVTVAEKEAVLRPDSVTLEGEVTPEAKEKLAESITEELGIPKENQQWSTS